jgi:chorismate mutase
MTDSEPSLDDLRREIDEIDDSLHALLMRRAEVQQRVGRAKNGNAAYIRPGREARVLRRLIGQHHGAFPKPVIVRIWREIFAAGLSLQAPFSVAVLAEAKGQCGLPRLAREHFGTLTRVQEFGTAGQVLQAVGEHRTSVGVLPMPESEERAPWWPNMARHGDGVPRIVARLPFAQTEPEHQRRDALAVMLGAPEETGDDRGYVALETPHGTSRSALRRVLNQAGFDVTDWKVHDGPGAVTYYLVECRSVVRPGDPRLDALTAAADGAVSQAWPLGGYAMPLGPADLR